MDSAEWDARYAASDLVWSAGPNIWVQEVVADLPPGRALDLAAGEGRNALWLAQRGWTVTAVDFSRVALDRAAALARARSEADPVRIRTVEADLLTYTPQPASADLVLVVYLHLPADPRRHVLRAAATAVAPGGHLLVVGHDSANLADGFGGPQDPHVLYTPDDVVADLDGSGLVVRRAQTVTRTVDTESGPRHALDALVLAARPA